MVKIFFLEHVFIGGTGACNDFFGSHKKIEKKKGKRSICSVRDIKENFGKHFQVHPKILTKQEL